MSIRYGDPSHPWPCPASVGHTTCLCDQEEAGTMAAHMREFHRAAVALWVAIVDALRLEALVAWLQALLPWLQALLVQPGRHRGARQPVSDKARAAAVAVVLVGYLFLVGVLA